MVKNIGCGPAQLNPVSILWSKISLQFCTNICIVYTPPATSTVIPPTIPITLVKWYSIAQWCCCYPGALLQLGTVGLLGYSALHTRDGLIRTLFIDYELKV